MTLHIHYFLKKIYVILKRLPEILKEFNDEIGTNAEIFINLWSDLEDKTYFYDNKGYIKLKYVKLTKVNYIVKVPTKFQSTIRLCINIKHVQKMKSTENITNVTNTLRYMWLLPKDELLIELDNMIQYLYNINKNKNKRRDRGNYKKLVKQIIYLSGLNGIILIFNKLFYNYLIKISGLRVYKQIFIITLYIFIITIDLLLIFFVYTIYFYYKY